jgi:hypothetical protein
MHYSRRMKLGEWARNRSISDTPDMTASVHKHGQQKGGDDDATDVVARNPWLSSTSEFLIPPSYCLGCACEVAYGRKIRPTMNHCTIVTNTPIRSERLPGLPKRSKTN